MIRKERELNVSYGDLPTPKYLNSGFSGTLDCATKFEAWCYLNAGATWVHPLTRERGICPPDPILPYYMAGRASAATLSSAPYDAGYEKFFSSSRPAPLFNTCEHEIVQGFNYPYLSSVISKGTCSNFRYRRYSVPTAYRYLNSCPVNTTVPWSAFESAQRRAWWSMQPRFETDVQLLNFIYELKDFRMLAKTLLNFRVSEIGAKLHQLKRNLTSLRRSEFNPVKLGYETLADITKVSAEARLVNEFAIKPMISDLTSMFTLLASTIDLAQSTFADRGKLSQLSHYTEEGNSFSNGSYGTGYYTPYYFGTHGKTIFTATMQYKYKYKMRTGWEKWKAGMGLEPTPEVIWNMIPFSFLVDYIYQIGNALRNMRLDPNVSMRLLQYCESILQYTSAGAHINTTAPALRVFFSPSNPMMGRGLVPISGYSRSLYRRRIGTPNKGAALPRMKTPSEGQLYNLAALIRCFFD